jgi:hypothetical protein
MTRPLKIVHTGLFGPNKKKGLKYEKYFMLLDDGYTRMSSVCFLKNKSKDFENFKIYKEMVENEMDSKIKCLRSDNEGEFNSKEFMDYYNNHGIKRQFSIASLITLSCLGSLSLLLLEKKFFLKTRRFLFSL